MTQLVLILISFFASVIGSICGIGGGVIIKPAMDAFGEHSVSTISFMSGCIVLAMTAYSVARAKYAKESVIDKGVGTYLGIGAALGGLAGKQIFDTVKSLFANADAVGAVQAVVLFAVTLLTAVYTLYKEKIRAKNVTSRPACVIIGLALGILSAFLGIGGGPVNLIVLYFFFSMETKAAAQNSLYIILISQSASLLFTIISGRTPEFPAGLLAAMVLCGITGGVAGRRINKKIDGKTVDKLFLGLLTVIMCVCWYNFARYR